MSSFSVMDTQSSSVIGGSGVDVPYLSGQFCVLIILGSTLYMISSELVSIILVTDKFVLVCIAGTSVVRSVLIGHTL